MKRYDDGRWRVARGISRTDYWFVWRGLSCHRGFTTHADTIAYADRMARTR